MTIDRRRPSPSSPAAPAGATDLKRIPLPPLPHFRRPDLTGAAAVPESPVEAPGPIAAPMTTASLAARGGPVSRLEMSELLSPDHEGGIVPAIEAPAARRSGATGATILNDLVDEIEKGLERDLARGPVEIEIYRRVLACGGPARGGPERRMDG